MYMDIIYAPLHFVVLVNQMRRHGLGADARIWVCKPLATHFARNTRGLAYRQRILLAYRQRSHRCTRKPACFRAQYCSCSQAAVFACLQHVLAHQPCPCTHKIRLTQRKHVWKIDSWTIVDYRSIAKVSHRIWINIAKLVLFVRGNLFCRCPARAACHFHSLCCERHWQVYHWC